MSSSTVSSLDSLVGLSGAQQVVRRIASGESSAHAVLLYGARGSGKNVLAQLLAQAWLCKSPTQDGADGHCKACNAFSRGANADLLTIAPTGNSSIIKVSAISEVKHPTDPKDLPIPLINFFRTAPLVSGHKVALIEQAHRMNQASFNSLLKTLEEPYPHARIVLTTDAVGSLPPTILSRCLAVACELPNPQEMAEMFPEATEADLVLSEGTPGRTAHILANPDRYRAIYAFAESLASRPPGEALVAAEQFRSICDGLEKALECGARAAQTEALEALAIALARSPAGNPAWSQKVLEAHRRVVGNSAIGLVLDALFTTMLTFR